MFNRFLAKLGGNFFSLLTAAIRLALVPRILGPEAYGRFEFLFSFFQQATTFIDMGTSECFYTKLSQRQSDRGLVRFFVFYVAGASALLLVVAAFLTQLSIGHKIWSGETEGYILLAVLLGCVYWWYQVVQRVVDAYGLTVKAEILGVVQKSIALIVLVVLVFGGWLSLASFLVFQILSFSLGIAFWIMLVSGSAGTRPVSGIQSAPKDCVKEFWRYSHPLFVYTLFGMVTGLLERWILQTHAGATQQAFYGLAYQISAVCMVFTGAMAQILWRENAIAWARKDLASISTMFTKYIPAFYSLASFFAVFVALRASDVLWVFGGKDFADGTMAMTLMALYPMHQTIGQFSASVYYTTDQTRLYRNILVVGMIVGLPLAFWLIVPDTMGGMGMGATGLALKMFLMQVLIVNVHVWFNARRLKVSFGRLIIHQIRIPIAFALLAWVVSAAVELVVSSRLVGLLASALVYFVFTIGVGLSFPQFFGVDPDDFRKSLSKISVLLHLKL